MSTKWNKKKLIEYDKIPNISLKNAVQILARFCPLHLRETMACQTPISLRIGTASQSYIPQLTVNFRAEINY